MVDFVKALINTYPYPAWSGKAAANIEDIREDRFWEEAFVELDEGPFVAAGSRIHPLFEEVGFEIDVVLYQEVIAKGAVVVGINVVGVDVS